MAVAVMHDTVLKCVCTIHSVYHYNVYPLLEHFQKSVHLQEQTTREHKR